MTEITITKAVNGFVIEDDEKLFIMKELGEVHGFLEDRWAHQERHRGPFGIEEIKRKIGDT